jgi:hypothetical protein
MDVKKVEFTGEQYLQLIKIVYLGRWMASSHTDEPDKPLEELEQYIFSHAKAFGHGAYVDFDPNYKKFFASVTLEDEMDPVIQNYDDFTFWDELAWRMAERDFAQKFDHAQVLCMTNDEIFRQKNAFADKYFDEFTTNGIDKLLLK